MTEVRRWISLRSGGGQTPAEVRLRQMSEVSPEGDSRRRQPRRREPEMGASDGRTPTAPVTEHDQRRK